ncbi:MAG: hypothetical protein COT71_03155 [Candidatus Andersenbacteria bacterium CG10_big_fil_rev_8_21_14_0_10_54_11]|uniref:Uncharacterized protein n=1 Tax=Candidatus Andersenbacteria bacterium CG10_big_fil_rev_8_21_14_0_10_54_11 TaxID=1974485 RepID=A0A2M6WYZ1_9BACT|nr:MAG: hypothetical protein COT71_03155 [Candidatus Andersenbacteria bacterium CG10_big_fil_rev_8_21_14_0_10_54_11]
MADTDRLNREEVQLVLRRAIAMPQPVRLLSDDVYDKESNLNYFMNRQPYEIEDKRPELFSKKALLLAALLIWAVAWILSRFKQ